MKIMMITSECVPYAKTGGLADVVGALPKALQKLGHQVIVVMPLYHSIDMIHHRLNPVLSPLGVWMGNTQEWCSVFVADNDGVPVYFIEFDRYFGRDGLYHDAAFNDYQDNPLRFGFLTRAALQLCQDIDFTPDIVHAHDWQTALAPFYLKTWHWDDPTLGRAASVLTIHNIAYQGVYSGWNLGYLGIQAENFAAETFEDHGQINFLKGGIFFADMVNTVSPTYAGETRTPELGYGLAPYLNNKGENYLGILNGADYDTWNPATDPKTPACYSAADLSGKAACKAELQKRFWLNVEPDVPVFGVISRFVAQKGLDMLARILDGALDTMRLQFVILGSGEKSLESFFSDLPARYPGRVGTYIGYHDELSHWIEAGSDFFVMPSIYEPCGLNQIYSLRYGTLPIVHATGGLDDTVQQYDERTGAGTGFKFWNADPTALYYTIGWAVSTYYDRKAHLKQMIQSAMAQEFSWERSAVEYELLYRRAIANQRAG